MYQISRILKYNENCFSKTKVHQKLRIKENKKDKFFILPT